MARAGRKDRGLLSKLDSAGKSKWYVRLYHDGKEKRFGPFKTKTDERDFYEKSKQEQRDGRFFPERYQASGAELIQPIIDDYLLTTSGKQAEKWERQYARWWGEWFKGQRTPALQPQAIEKARLALAKGIRYLKDASDTLKETQGKGRSYATINRYTDWLRHVLNWAIKQKRIRENPVLAIERKPEEEAPIFQYSVEQEAKLIEQLNAEEIDLLRLAILSGLRQGNQFPLRKERINLGHGIILIPRTKNRKPRVVHLAEETKELVRRQMARHMESPPLSWNQKFAAFIECAMVVFKTVQTSLRAGWDSCCRRATALACPTQDLAVASPACSTKKTQLWRREVGPAARQFNAMYIYTMRP